MPYHPSRGRPPELLTEGLEHRDQGVAAFEDVVLLEELLADLGDPMTIVQSMWTRNGTSRASRREDLLERLLGLGREATPGRGGATPPKARLRSASASFSSGSSSASTRTRAVRKTAGGISARRRTRKRPSTSMWLVPSSWVS